MSEQNLSSIPVTHRDMAAQMKGATDLIKSVSWEVEPVIDRNDPSAYTKTTQRNEEVVSITDLVKGINPEDELLSDPESHTLRAIRTGLQIGRHIAEDYSARAGVPDQSGMTGLTSAQLTEINEKKQTAAAIAQFVAMNYVVAKTKSMVDGNSFAGNVNVAVDEIELQSVVKSLRCAMFYLGRNIAKETHNDEQRFVAVVHDYAMLLRQEILNRVGSLKHANFFTGLVYQAEHDDFTVAGFDIMSLSQNPTEIKEVYPDDIIGNDTAKLGIEKALRKLFLYDVQAGVNPIKAFGGFEGVRLLSGDPGGGKTLLLSMARTLARDYSEASGQPYRDLIVPNMVSKMQGESTDLAKEYLRQLLDPSAINLGIGDEFEAVLPDHGGENISEGDKKVAVEFLKALSGVGSVDRMNYLFLAATNYPELLDKAFMSRVKSRDFVTGAETIDDYVRFLILNLRKLNKLYPSLINLKNVDWERDLRQKDVIDASYLRIDPTMSVADLRAVVLEHHDPDDIKFFATFFYLMKQRQSTFSLRDCANTLDGAKAHVAGFEVPLDWITDPKHYIEQELDHKEGLISELAAEHVNTSGVNFVEMLDQKAVYYASEALRMAETKRQREVDEMAERLVVNHLAQKTYERKMNINT